MDIDTLLAQAAETLFRHGSHRPTLCIDLEGMATPLVSSFRFFPASAEQKQELLYQRGRRLAGRYGQRKVQRVWFVTEAWVNKRAPGTAFVAPSLDPRREEVLLVLEVHATSPDWRQTLAGRKMIRNEAGRLIDLHPLADHLPKDEENAVTSELLLAFLAGFIGRAAAYQGSDQLARLFAHILVQRLLLAGFVVDDP
jgi:hypothetical protein